MSVLTLITCMLNSSTFKVLLTPTFDIKQICGGAGLLYISICRGLGVAMALSFIYILLLRCIAGPIIGLGIFLAFLLVIAGTYMYICVVQHSKYFSAQPTKLV